MATFNISNQCSGADLGNFEGANRAEALDAMARAADYKNFTDMCARLDDHSSDLVVTEITGGAIDIDCSLRAQAHVGIKATYDSALTAACELATPDERRYACDVAHVRYEEACAKAGIQLDE
jgi:hypothetical protein